MASRILAEQRSYFVCERCGQPGRLRDRGGFFFTACDAHATKDGQIAKIVEKQSIIRMDGKRMKYSPERDEMVEVKRMFEEVEGLSDLDVRAIKSYIMKNHAYDFEDFTVLYAVKRLDWGWEGAGYSTVVRLANGDIELIDTETVGPKPTEGNLEETIKLYRQLADQTEAMLARFRKLKGIKGDRS